MHHHNSLVSSSYRDVLAVILRNSRKQIIPIFSARKADYFPRSFNTRRILREQRFSLNKNSKFIKCDTAILISRLDCDQENLKPDFHNYNQSISSPSLLGSQIKNGFFARTFSSLIRTVGIKFKYQEPLETEQRMR